MKNLEIERKFLIEKEKWEKISKPQGKKYYQGYLSIDDCKSVRVRITGNQGFITIKGRAQTFSHPEFEYEIPAEDARELLRSYVISAIEKTRYRIPFSGFIWEVDVFNGENKGLIMAEIELRDPDEKFEIPEWVGKEVTGDERYYNANLSKNPISNWHKKTR